MPASRFRNSSLARLLVLPLVASLGGLVAGCKVFESEIADPAALGLTTAPEPATAEASDDPEYAWMATFTATLAETGGVGAAINSVNATLSEVVDGTVVVGGATPLVKLDVSTSASRVEPNGTVTIDVVVHYTLPAGGRQAVVDVVVRATDDWGYTLAATSRSNLE